jgi:hypothetical protein
MLLKNLWDAHRRAAGLAKLYAESSEELIDVFQHVSSHIEQVIDYVGADKFFSRFTDDKTPESADISTSFARTTTVASPTTPRCVSSTLCQLRRSPRNPASSLRTSLRWALPSPTRTACHRRRSVPGSNRPSRPLQREATLLLGPFRSPTSITRLVAKRTWICSQMERRGLRSRRRFGFSIRCTHGPLT